MWDTRDLVEVSTWARVTDAIAMDTLTNVDRSTGSVL